MWVRLVTRRSRTALIAIGLVTVAAGWVAATEFRMNSDLGGLIDQSSGWRQDFDAFKAQFPDLVRTAVLVVSSESVTAVETATGRILTYLEAHPERFGAIAAPGSEAFFRDHALLYMTATELEQVTDRLAAAQPWLGAVAADPSLRGVLGLIETGACRDTPPDFERFVARVQAAAEGARRGAVAPVAWADEIFPLDAARYQLIYLKAGDGAETTVADAEVMAALRSMLAELDLGDEVTVRITGEVALQHEEIEAAITGVTFTGWLAAALLLLVLVVGVRSVKIVLATFSMLAVGVVWTTAYAMLGVGEFNTLSVVFLVMFFGLGVDFALHFSLRFQEAENHGDADVSDALVLSTRSVGRAILLCTLTTAIGFMSFYPTAYQGLADLGLISAGGMAIACFLTFTYLPAFYALTGPPRAHRIELPTSERVVRWLNMRRRGVLVTVLLLGVAGGVLTARATFDYSVLAIKDPQSESMRTLRLLQAEGLSTDYQLVLVGDDLPAVSALEALPEVAKVETVAALLPAGQAERLAAIEELGLFLEPALWPFEQAERPGAAEQRAAAVALRETLVGCDTVGNDALPEAARKALAGSVDGVLASTDTGVWLRWENALLAQLLPELEWLRRALSVGPVTLDDVPATTRSRVVTSDGRQLVRILPAEDIEEVTALSRFIEAVREPFPHVTGRPVLEWGVGGIVLTAFQQALLLALAAIGLVLIVALRSLVAAGLVLIPLVLAGTLSLGVGVLLGLPVNMANILVIPLIFGLGVDNGIHVVDRYLGEGDVDQLLASSTPRAVLLSTLTTLGAFAALSLSPHQGTASMGLLLTISVTMLLVFTVFLLPVLLSMARLRRP